MWMNTCTPPMQQMPMSMPTDMWTPDRAFKYHKEMAKYIKKELAGKKEDEEKHKRKDEKKAKTFTGPEMGFYIFLFGPIVTITYVQALSWIASHIK